MEAPWKRRFTSITRKPRSPVIRDAECQYQMESPAAPESNQSPAQPAYIPVNKAEAIAKLCIQTGNEKVDDIHEVLIDLLQHGYIYAVCTPTDPSLRYNATEEGKRYVRESMDRAVDEFLGRMFDD